MPLQLQAQQWHQPWGTCTGLNQRQIWSQNMSSSQIKTSTFGNDTSLYHNTLPSTPWRLIYISPENTDKVSSKQRNQQVSESGNNKFYDQNSGDKMYSILRSNQNFDSLSSANKYLGNRINYQVLTNTSSYWAATLSLPKQAQTHRTVPCQTAKQHLTDLQATCLFLVSEWRFSNILPFYLKNENHLSLPQSCTAQNQYMKISCIPIYQQ